METLEVPAKEPATKVLMLLENNPYPQDDRVQREARTLVAAGYQVSVICPSVSGQSSHQVLDGVSIWRFPAPPPANHFLGYVLEYGYSMLAAFFASLLVLMREGFDIVHAHNPPDTFVFIAALYKLLGKGFVYDHHDLAPEMYYSRFRGSGNRLVFLTLLLFERLSCQMADHVIATNQSYKTIDTQRAHVPEERITIVRNGPDLQCLTASSPPSLVPQDGAFKICYVGVMGFQDGVDYLLRALKHLVCDLERTDFLCVLVGAGDAFRSLQSLAEQLELTHLVLFTGWVEHAEVARYLAAADICVSPEPSDPYNDCSTTIKIMEYMALGKPIVAFDLPEHRFTAQDAAAYARPNDEFDFARQIVALMNDPARREGMGRVGRKRVEKELAWHHQEKYLLDMYDCLGASLHRHNQPSGVRDAGRGSSTAKR